MNNSLVVSSKISVIVCCYGGEATIENFREFITQILMRKIMKL